MLGGFLLIVAVAACSIAPQLGASPTPTVKPVDTAVRPSATPRPTETPTPASTATPTATNTPESPLGIEYMRRQTYPGSDLTIEETLEPGADYDRYLVSYRSDGLKIYALMTVPRGEKPKTGWPVVVFNHGYIPPAQYRPTERYIAYVDAFARSGYIVFRPDYRGHGNSEGRATGAFTSADYTVDVLNAVSTIKGYQDADPQRIGMWGHSMGGGITLRAMVVTDDMKAGVIWAGTVGPYQDLLRRWSRAPTPGPGTPVAGRRVDELTARYGSPEESPEFWEAISPNTYLADLSGPVQLHHGTADESVPLEYSEVLYAQIRAVDKTVEYYTYSGDNHNISNNLAVALQRSVAFFDRYVKGATAAGQP
jgi:dipeptidyl aminopeptidase/acylaminoacyl peptidase